VATAAAGNNAGGAGGAGGESADRSPLRHLYAGCTVLAALALVGMFLLMIGETVLRKFLGGYIPGAGQLIAWCGCAAAFLAMPQAFRQADFVRVELATAWLGPRARRATETLALLLMLGFCAFATFGCARYVQGAMAADELTQGMLEVPLAWVQASLVVGLAVLTLAVAEALWATLRGRLPLYAQRQAEREAAHRVGEGL
jgi:TRAP-type C4-dicarboxylate transport system permease small subunit